MLVKKGTTYLTIPDLGIYVTCENVEILTEDREIIILHKLSDSDTEKLRNKLFGGVNSNNTFVNLDILVVVKYLGKIYTGTPTTISMDEGGTHKVKLRIYQVREETA